MATSSVREAILFLCSATYLVQVIGRAVIALSTGTLPKHTMCTVVGKVGTLGIDACDIEQHGGSIVVPWERGWCPSDLLL